VSAALKIDARRKRIMEELERSGHVSISQLSAMLGATTVTIRNDLDVLEANGHLDRVQGGAVLRAPLSMREGRGGMVKEKRAIAIATVAHIQDGDTLFINSGTTTMEVAHVLRSHCKDLNIVTSSLAIASELSAVPGFRVLLLGGELNVQYGFTCGGDAQEQLAKYQADHCILTLDGVSCEEGITTYHADETIIDRMMVERAKHAIVVADHSKIGRVGFSRICPLTMIHTLITDDGGNKDAIAAVADKGVEVVCAALAEVRGK